jgi:hypothetical protein
MKKGGYIINHLNDSIQAHPNNIRVVYDCIREIYLSNLFINCLNELVFTNLRSNLIPEFHCEFDEIVNIFKKEFKPVEIKGEYFNEENLLSIQIDLKKIESKLFIISSLSLNLFEYKHFVVSHPSLVLKLIKIDKLIKLSSYFLIDEIYSS